MIVRGKLKPRYPIYRAFNPNRSKIIIEKGIDRTPDYISEYERINDGNENIIYAEPLYKAIEHTISHFRKY